MGSSARVEWIGGVCDGGRGAGRRGAVVVVEDEGSSIPPAPMVVAARINGGRFGGRLSDGDGEGEGDEAGRVVEEED